jgi:hypothetical protein
MLPGPFLAQNAPLPKYPLFHFFKKTRNQQSAIANQQSITPCPEQAKRVEGPA